MRLIAIFILCVASIAFGESQKFIVLSRACEIRDSQLDDAKVNCKRDAGDSVQVVDEMAAGFFVDATGCDGFVPRECVTGSLESEAVNGPTLSGLARFSVGVSSSIEFPTGDIKDDTKDATGSGFMVGGVLRYRFEKHYGIGFTMSRYAYSLKRAIGGSSAHVTMPAMNFSQELRFLGVGLMGSYYFEDRGNFSGENSNFNLGCELGIDYLIPLSGSQQSADGSVTFTTPGRPLLGVVGLFVTLPVGRTRFGLQGSVQAFANLTSTSNARFMGGRVLLILNFQMT